MGQQYAKPPLQPAQFVRNGRYPDAYLQGELAGLANHLAMVRMKEVVSFGMTTDVIASVGVGSTSDPRPRWRVRYRPSPYALAVIVRGWLAESTLATHAIDPYALIEFDNGSDTGSAELHYGNMDSEDATPDHMGLEWTFVRASGSALFTPTQNTTYDVLVSDVDSRLSALTIYETRLTFEAPFAEGYASGGPILDIDRGNIMAAARTLWKRQAAPLFTWTVDDQAAPRSTLSTTEKNLIDDTSTTVAADKPGFTLDLRLRTTQRRGTVPCLFSAYVDAVDEGDVILKDSTGAQVGILTCSGAAGWFEDTVNLPATLAKYDLHYRTASASDAFDVYAVCLQQYEA